MDPVDRFKISPIERNSDFSATFLRCVSEILLLHLAT